MTPEQFITWSGAIMIGLVALGLGLVGIAIGIGFIKLAINKD